MHIASLKEIDPPALALELKDTKEYQDLIDLRLLAVQMLELVDREIFYRSPGTYEEVDYDIL